MIFLYNFLIEVKMWENVRSQIESWHSFDVKADTLHKDLCSSKLANCDWSKLWFPLHRKITFQLYDALT